MQYALKSLIALLGVSILAGCTTVDSLSGVAQSELQSIFQQPDSACVHYRDDVDRRFSCLENYKARSLDSELAKYSEMALIAAEHQPSSFPAVGAKLAKLAEKVPAHKISDQTATFAAIGAIVGGRSVDGIGIPTRISDIVNHHCAPLRASDLSDQVLPTDDQMALDFEHHMKQACYSYFNGDTARALRHLDSASYVAEALPVLKRRWMDAGIRSGAEGGYRHLQYQLSVVQ